MIEVSVINSPELSYKSLVQLFTPGLYSCHSNQDIMELWTLKKPRFPKENKVETLSSTYNCANLSGKPYTKCR